MSAPASPDENARGLLAAAPDALRYDGQTDDPHEVAGIMRAAMPAGIRVLDVGCGTGSVTLIVNLGKGNDVVCVEPDRDRAAVAATRGLNVANRLLDADFLAEHGPFDAAVLSDVLEHLSTPAELMQLVLSGLKPGGLVLASVPNVAHWTVRANMLLGRFDYAETGIYDSTHLRWFTEKTLRSFFTSLGAEVLWTRQAAGIELPVYHTSRILRRIPAGIRNPTIRQLNRIAPRVMGSQHVIAARKRT